MPSARLKTRRRASTPKRRTAAELAERAKELRCLIAVSRALSRRSTSLAQAFARVVEDIPSGWQFPALAAVRLTWHGREWKTPGFRVTPWTMAQPIRGRVGPVGAIEVAYRERPVSGSAKPFLPEETRLLKAIAERVADVIELEHAVGELDAYQDRLRSLASQLARTEERERRDIATYLHDRIGQDLALIKLRLESIRGGAQTSEHNRVIDQVCDLAADVLQKTRTLIFEISPPILHELGLGAAIEWLADGARAQHGLAVSVDAESLPPLDDDLKALAFRSTNELVNNVVRHAAADTMTIRVRTTNTKLRIEVEDNGRGFDPHALAPIGAGGAFGLFSVRERLAYVGGALELVTAPGKGTRAIIEAPLVTARKDAS